MICNGCGNKFAYRWKKYYENGVEICDRCGYSGNTGIPDVYWDGKEEHGLADDPITGKPMVFGSKVEKARYLKERNLVEAGDKVHGSHPSILNQRKTENPREVAMQALKYVREMGRDKRRSEFQRIMKENGRL